MIKITIELKSARTGKTTKIGVATISNRGSNKQSPKKGGYSAVFFGKTWRSVRYARLEDFPRMRKNVWDLLQLLLAKRTKKITCSESDGYFFVTIPDEFALRYKLVDGVLVRSKQRGRETIIYQAQSRARVRRPLPSPTQESLADASSNPTSPSGSSSPSGPCNARKSRRNAR